MDDPGAIDDELLRLAGNSRIAAATKENLRRLTTGVAGPDLAEMAEELLAGRTSLRKLGQSAAYAPQLSEAFAKFQQWQSELSPEERRELERKAQEKFGAERDEQT
jgi:hypothetical protein